MAVICLICGRLPRPVERERQIKFFAGGDHFLAEGNDFAVVDVHLLGKPMDSVFTNPLDLFAIAGTAWIVNAIAADGETTWFEGVLLIGVYALLGLGFLFLPAERQRPRILESRA